MKTRNYWLSAVLSILGIIAPAFAYADNTPQACRPEVKKIDDRFVSLTWNNVEQVYGIFDDFEDHEDFAINSPGKLGWSYLDMDNERTFAIGSYVYENSSQPKAFQIWNPHTTIPPYPYDKAWPHGGNKCLLSAATLSGKRNDWIISPDLNEQHFAEDFTLSFWAHSLSAAYGLEKVKIGYSLTDKNINSFTFLNDGEPIEIPATTDQHPSSYYFKFSIPKEARYVAINCVTDGDGGQALFIDDIAIAVNKIMPNRAPANNNYLVGFNLYRNGEKVNKSLITQHSYTDTVPDYTTYAYQVESVFETGDPVKGVSVDVEVPNIHLLPFIEDWASYNFATNYWEVSCPGSSMHGVESPCFWSISYRPYTLYTEAAQFYPYSSLTNYKDYCVTSKELDATNLEGVMMCYDIGLDAYELTGSSRNGEAIAVEVFDGTQWIKVDERRDDRGDYAYTRFYVDLSQYVAGKKFRIRFNASGKEAFNIVAWYISYVRVYEKAKANVSGTVLCAGEPVAGATVVFTSSENDVYTAVTAADGTYSVPDVDSYKYTVSINQTGYNPYSAAVTINKGENNNVDIAMTRPVIGLASDKQTHTMTAEAIEQGTISLQNTGNGPARVGMWIDYENKTVSAAPSFEVIKTFNTSEILQASIGFDGEYFYMAKSDEYSNDALIYKYDRNSNLVETFMPNIHLRQYFAMAYDGENFYVASGDSIIRVLDMKNGIVLGEILTELEGICHIAYDETQDAFWVGALNSLALVDRNGKIIRNEVIYNSEEVLFSGSAYDPYFKDGPCLWIMDRSHGNNPTTNLTSAVIRRIDLKDMRLKNDYFYMCDELPGFQYGNSTIGPVWGEGLFGTTRYKDGHFVLMGVIMEAPGLVGILDMYEVPSWLKIDGYGFNMEASGSKQVSYTVDATSMVEGDNRKATVTFRLDPQATPLTFEVTADVNAKAQYAMPLALRAIADKDVAAKLSWTAPQAATAPASYNIYRNGEKIASATTLSYTDNNLKAGAYSYTVSAVYAGNHESQQSKEAKINIKAGIACYAPFDLTAANVHNTSIALAWKDPSVLGTQPTILRWGNGVTTDGILAPEDFMGAALWSPQDLIPYHNMVLKSVTFVPYTTEADFTVKIFEDDELVYSQKVSEDDIIPQKPCTVTLKESYIISDRQDLRVGIEVSNYEDRSGAMALGVDGGPAINRKGNWLYMRSVGWFTVGSAGLTNVNISITLNLEPKTTPEPLAKGYNVYRNGEKITNTPVTVCQYSDPVTTPGLYTYTVTALHDNGESYACPPASARIVDISAHNAPEDLSARVSMNRNVMLHWNNPNTRVASKSAAGEYKPFGYISHFDVLQPTESAVVTDGQFIYTSHRDRNGEFHKYDMQGNFIETFTIEDVRSISDMTYDGRYFYGCNFGFVLYCLDFTNKTLVKTMTLTETARHITYIPELNDGKGGFEIGDWTTSSFVDMNGTFIGTGYSGLDGAFGAAYHDGKIYYSQQGDAGLCEVMEVDFATLQPTGNSSDLSDSRYLNLAANSRSGGLSLYEAANGTAVLVLAIQQPVPERNKIVFLEATQNAHVAGFNIYRDNTKVNDELVLVRDYTDVVTTPGDYSYTVSAVYVDEVESTKSNSVSVTIVEPTHCEAPVHVRADVEKRNVRLQWTSVLDMENRGDSMETYAHLATGKVGNWITIDGDGLPVYVGDNFAFQGMDKAQTFFIVDEESINEQHSGYAFSGTKSFVCAAAWDANNAAKTDDWLITEAKDPRTGQAAKWVSFMARGLEASRKENFTMTYSTMGTELNTFIDMTAFPERVDYLWTRYTYQLPEGTQYVAIHYTSLDGRALFIDDVNFGSGACPFMVGSDYGLDEEFVEAVEGYYIYRNGQRLNNEPVKESSFFDGNLANGEYTYEIQALYNTSCESDKSEPVKINVDYEGLCNAPEGLYADVVGHDVFLGWTEPFYDDPVDLTYVRSVDLGGAIGWTVPSVYYVAYKWEAADLMAVSGYRLDAVAALFYMAPDDLNLMIYQGGELMYEQNVTRDCAENLESLELSFFVLNTPYQVDLTKDLMIAFRIYGSSGGELTMCYSADAADNGYGNLYSDDASLWYSAYTYSGGQWKGNWFMIALFDMGLPTAGGDFQGFRVYRDGSAITSNMLSELTYADRNVFGGTHSYQVAAVYESCGEKLSQPVRVTLTANESDVEAGLVTVWPNPAHESVTVRGEYKKLEIVDVQGKVRITAPAGNNDVIDIRQLPAGVYFVRIETAQGTQVRKLVVW